MKLTDILLYDTQTVLKKSNRKCDALSEEYTKQLAQRDEIYRQNLSLKEETFNKQLLEQEEESNCKLSDLEAKLMDGLTKTEIKLKEVVSEKDKLFELCINWKAKTAELEEKEQKLIEEKNHLQVSCSADIWHSDNFGLVWSWRFGVKKESWGHLTFQTAFPMKLTNVWLHDTQTALQESNQKCDSLLNFTKQLAATDTTYNFTHSQDLESLEKQLSEQAEKNQNQLSDLREKEQKVHCLMEENNQLQVSCSAHTGDSEVIHCIE